MFLKKMTTATLCALMLSASVEAADGKTAVTEAVHGELRPGTIQKSRQLPRNAKSQLVARAKDKQAQNGALRSESNSQPTINIEQNKVEVKKVEAPKPVVKKPEPAKKVPNKTAIKPAKGKKDTSSKKVIANEPKTAPKAEEHSSRYEEKEVVLSRKDAQEIKKQMPKGAKTPTTEQRVYYNGLLLPRDYREISISGEPEATMGQCAAFLKKIAPHNNLDCTIEELVEFYWKEGKLEGVRPDLAFCQAVLETGYFRFGGDVSHHQNNFCGLGTVGGGARGAGFRTPQLGVRAHIQHLLAYSRLAKPSTKIVDPRYELAHDIRKSKGLVTKWSGLNGTWAMGREYCEKIMSIYVNVLDIKGVPDTFDTKLKSDGTRISFKERMAKIHQR